MSVVNLLLHENSLCLNAVKLTQIMPSMVLLQAAEARAAQNVPLAVRHMADIIAREPDHARAFFAMGQLQADLRQWRISETAFSAAANLESDPLQRGRCWFGAGECATGVGLGCRESHACLQHIMQPLLLSMPLIGCRAGRRYVSTGRLCSRMCTFGNDEFCSCRFWHTFHV